MKKYPGQIALAMVLGMVWGKRDFTPDYAIELAEIPGSISTSEDPMARFRYEMSMIWDPVTRRVPAQIRKKELLFSRSIPTRQAYLQTEGGRVSDHRTYELAGPFNVGGRTRAAALDIRDENTILAGGVSGGMWKTTDGGVSWKRTSDPTHRNSITTLAQDTRTGNEDTWYHGTGELVGNSARSLGAPYRGSGIYKSLDGGESWQQLPSTGGDTPNNFSSQFQYIWRIETNHTNTTEDEVLVAAYGAILRSADGGATWTAELGQELHHLPDTTDLNCSNAPFYTELKKSHEGYFFAALSSASSAVMTGCEESTLAPSAGFYFSPDGQNWQEITPPQLPEYYERTVIGIGPGTGFAYFLAVDSDRPQEQYFLYRYDIHQVTNGTISGTWTDLSANMPAKGGTYGDYDSQGGYNMVVEAHPAHPHVVYIGGTNLYRSTDGFASRENTKWIGGYSPANTGALYPGHHADQHLFIFYPSDPDRMITANDGGLRRTASNLADSVQWTSLNNGYLTSQFYTIAQQADTDSDAILGGMQDNGSYMRDALGANPSWTRILGGDGGYCAISPDAQLVYVAFQESQIYRLTLTRDKQLTSFARVDPTGGGETDGQKYLFINPYVLDPSNASRMFLAGGDRLWRNENLAQVPGGSQKKTSVNWSRMRGTRLSSGVYTALAKARTEDVLYAATIHQTPRIYRVTNASLGEEESVVTHISPLFPEFGHIACIPINPENADHILVVFSNYNVPSVFMSTNGGETFADISGNLEENPDGSGSGPSVRWGVIVPVAKNGEDSLEYYLGTSTGLYSTRRIDGAGTTWVKEGDDVIGNAVVTMMNYRSYDGRMVIASHGTGTFRMFVDDARQFQNQPAPGDHILLSQNFPNPFADRTYIDFHLPENSTVQLDLYNNAGQLVRNLLWGPQYAGQNRAVWDGTNTSGVQVASGMYYYVLTVNGKKYSNRLLYKP